MSDQIDFDLSADDPAPTTTDADAVAGETDVPTDDSHDADADADADTDTAPDIDALGRQHAKETLADAEGIQPHEQAAAALDTVEEQYAQLEQGIDQLNQRADQLDQTDEKLATTIERLHSQRDEDPVIQTLAGGVSVEVPPATAETDDDELHTRSDVIADLEEGRAQIAAAMDDLEDTLGDITRKQQVVEAALDHLEHYRDMAAPNQPAATGQPEQGVGEVTPVRQSEPADHLTDAQGFPFDPAPDGE